nr:hypothetical protein CFP56_04350 [Quercus suber]
MPRRKWAGAKYVREVVDPMTRRVRGGTTRLLSRFEKGVVRSSMKGTGILSFSPKIGAWGSRRAVVAAEHEPRPLSRRESSGSGAGHLPYAGPSFSPMQYG